MKKFLIPAAVIIVAGASLVAFKANQGDKVTICHNNHEITVSVNAIPAHNAHGDNIGGCGVIDPF